MRRESSSTAAGGRGGLLQLALIQLLMAVEW
jgi:hypothetical protein